MSHLETMTSTALSSIFRQLFKYKSRIPFKHSDNFVEVTIPILEQLSADKNVKFDIVSTKQATELSDTSEQCSIPRAIKNNSKTNN